MKIDKRDVQTFLHSHRDAAVIQTVRILCGTLNIRLVAEGMETAAGRKGR